nr:uncharacterized protein LOC105964676 [Ipomoea trifida]
MGKVESQRSVFDRLGSNPKAPKRKSIHDRLGAVQLMTDNASPPIESKPSKRLRSMIPSRMRRQTDIHVSCREVLKVQPSTIVHTRVRKRENEESVGSTDDVVPPQGEEASSFHITLRDETSIEGEDTEETHHELEEGVRATIDELKEGRKVHGCPKVRSKARRPRSSRLPRRIGVYAFIDHICRHRGLLEAVMTYDGIYVSLFTYDRSTHIVQAFCEAWCLMTNTLLSSVDELLFSLWDMHVLCSLPIFGDVYDEYVPTASELTGTYIDPTSTPQCCKCLFQVYNYLYNRCRQPGGGHNQKDEGHSIHINEWIEFWSRRSQIYERPLPRKEDTKKSRPKNTQNLNGKIPAFKGWTKATRVPFVELRIPPEIEEETHLAAYLSCWLCVFVLPIKATRLIRYVTFKMATCQTLNLAIPVLASIYNGLNAISNSAQPGQADSRFSIHYVYGWLSFYYDTHFANDHVSTSPLMITNSGEGGEVETRRKIFKADSANWSLTLLIDLVDSLATIRTAALAYWAMMSVESHLRRVFNVDITLQFGAQGHK